MRLCTFKNCLTLTKTIRAARLQEKTQTCFLKKALFHASKRVQVKTNPRLNLWKRLVRISIVPVALDLKEQAPSNSPKYSLTKREKVHNPNLRWIKMKFLLRSSSDLTQVPPRRHSNPRLNLPLVLASSQMGSPSQTFKCSTSLRALEPTVGKSNLNPATCPTRHLLKSRKR